MTGNNRQGMLLCLVGPSAGGKTTIGAELLETFGQSMQLSVSATSRPPRESEKDGESYIFLSREEFQGRIKNGEFFEWEEIHGNFYGTLKSTVDRAVDSGIDLLLDIDIQGALNFKRRFAPATVIVFLVPPSREVLLERLRSRGKVDEKEVQRRLDTAIEEYRQFFDAQLEGGLIDYFIVNDALDTTISISKSIVSAERVRLSRWNSDFVAKICQI